MSAEEHKPNQNGEAQFETIIAKTSALPLQESLRQYKIAISTLNIGELPQEYQVALEADLAKAQRIESEIRERVQELTTLFRNLDIVD